MHRFGLPPAPAGRLMVVSARSDQDLVLSLERADAEGRWSVARFERGTAPLAAVPSDGDTAKPWRVAVWAVDGGPARISVAVRAVEPMPPASGTVALQPVPFGAGAPMLRAALLAAPASSLLTLQTRPEGLLEGSLPGHLLQPVTDRTLVPQADTTWILARAPAQDSLVVEPAAIPADGVSLTVPGDGARDAAHRCSRGRPCADLAGRLDLRPAGDLGGAGLRGGPGQRRWRWAGDQPLGAWNAGGHDPLPLRIGSADLTLGPEQRTDGDLALTLPERTPRPSRCRPAAIA